MAPWLFYFLEAMERSLWLFLFWQFAEKVIFSRLLKKGPASAEASAGRQMQVESSKSRLLGAPEILRVASRRIRSDVLPRRRVGESARGVPGCTLQRRRMRGTPQMAVFQQPASDKQAKEEQL